MSQLIAPPEELVNAFEFEAVARRKLDGATFAGIAGSDRKAFDRITFRPRMMVNSTGLDLSVELFGQTLFAPILVGPVSRQNRFHPEGELAMARGAAAAKATMIVASDSNHPVEKIASVAKTPFWLQVNPEPDINTVRGRIQEAAKLGCKAVCLSTGADWSAIDRLRHGLTVPLLLKGIMSAGEAATAVQRGVQGIIVSNYRGPADSGLAAPIEVLPFISEAVAGKVPILIDGSFRRGSDILKALALGARAVLLGRPPVWGLAAYGAAGVQQILQLLQTELARDMAMCGAPNLKALSRATVKIHRW